VNPAFNRIGRGCSGFQTRLGAKGIIPTTNGFPGEAVRAILQDNHDAMWFGTDHGLIKYDGAGRARST
jgi:ligand-binding sensor domain-containing protein